MGPTTKWKYFTQVFIGTKAKIQVFCAFDQFSSISGWKVRVKLPILCFLAITFEPEMLESQSKAQKTQIFTKFPRQIWVKYFHTKNETQNLKTS